MKKHVLVLGAGFGGLELATRLSETVPDLVDVTLLDRNDSFFFGFSKLEVMLGRQSAEEVRMYYGDIAKEAVEFRQETVTGIDPAARRVATDAGSHDAEFLVVAMGADYDLEATPGLETGGHEYYSMAGAERWAAGLGGPAYAIDDETAIKVVDGVVEVISEGQWTLLAPGRARAVTERT